jgi:hypothetical protein
MVMSEIGPIAPISLIDRFQSIRNPVLGVNPDALPSKIPPVIENQEDIQTLFSSARSLWETSFNRQTLLDSVETIKTDPNNCDGALKNISTIRKYGLVMKSAYTLLDETHYCPPHHHQLMKSLGKLKDFYNRPEATEYAQQVINTLHYYPEHQDDFHPSTVESFQNYFNSILTLTENGLQTNVMTRKEFHRLRKNGVKHIMNLYQLAALNKTDKNVQQTFQFLCKTNSLMGDIHDTLVQTETPETINTPFTIDQKVTSRIQLFLNRSK